MSRRGMREVSLLLRLLLVGGVVGLVLGACGSKSVCSSSAQCGSAERCLASQICAATCTVDRDCGGMQRCGASGGCIDTRNGCGVDADCHSGWHCQLGGVCVEGGPSGGASGGGAAGRGGGGGGSGGGGGGGGSSVDPGSCAEVFQAASTPANVMLALDSSVSMGELVGGTSKWSAATAAVTQMTNGAPSAHFGLEVFSVGLCGAGEVKVAIDGGSAAAVQAALPLLPGGVGTPIAAGLTVAGTDPSLTDPARSEAIVLITDGQENCLGDPVAVVGQLFARPVSVRTFVVGFGATGGAGVNATVLSNMAVKGGTARLAIPRYYQANVPEDLQAALTAISNQAMGCDFTLSRVPGNLSQLYVAINQQLVQRDVGHVTGWDYDPATNRLTLYGPACDALANTPGAKLNVQFGCSDGFIEGGGDGGFDFGVDAGELG